MSDALIGGGLSLVGSVIGGGMASDAASEAAQAAEYDPYDITSGLGTGLWEGQSGTAALSPEWQQQQQQYLGQSNLFNQQLMDFYAQPNISDYTTYANYQPTQTLEDFLAQQGAGTTGTGGGGVTGTGGDIVGSGVFTHPGDFQTSYASILNPTYDLTAQPGYVESFDPSQGGYTALGNGVYQSLLGGWQNQGGSYFIPEGTSLSDLPENIQQEILYTGDDGNIFTYAGGGTGTGGELTAEQQATAQQQYEDYLAGAGGTVDQEGYQSALDAYKSPEQVIYDRLSQLAEGGESLQRSGLESRLFAQGMLGSTGGGHRTAALERSLGEKGLAREQMAVTLTQQIQNMIQQRGLAATSAALGIDQASLDALRLGAGVGQSQAAAGAIQGGILANAGAQQGGAIANAFSSFGQNLPAGLFSSSPSTPSLGGTSPGFGSGSYTTPSYYSPGQQYGINF